MKFALQICVAGLLALTIAEPAAAADDEKETAGAFRHAVFFKFKEDATAEQVAKIESEFKALKSKIDTIVDFEWGPSESVEGLNDGFTHCFLVTFADKKGLEVYIPHDDHQAFVALLKPSLEKVFVFDYTARD